MQEDDRTPADLLAAAFTGEDLLIVLDNLEQIAGAEQSIASLLGRCPSITVLATSRRSVGLSGEQLWPVDPLALPKRNDPDAIATSPAVSFFLSAARRARPGFALTPGNAATVAAIVRQLDGLPLAIELAAARLRMLSLDALLARLRQPLALLAGGARSLPSRQQTIRATIAWSVDLLSSTERALYEDLGVFRSGFSPDAVTAICRRESDELLAALSTLIDQSLVQTVELDDGEIRYSMLATIREEALERLQARSDAEEVRAAHATWFGLLAEELSPLLLGADQVNAFDRLERELANLESALSWSLEQGDGERMLRIAGAIWRFWYERGSPSEGRRWLERALGVGINADSRLRARALNGLGALCLVQSDYQSAREAFQGAIAAWEGSAEERWRCGSLNNLALLELRTGNPAAARDGFEQALACFRSVSEESGAAFALDNLGYAHHDLGEFRRAQAMHQEALAIQEKLGNAQGIATALHNLGVTASALGDNVAASQFHERQLSIVRELGHRGSEALALNSLGFLASQSGDFVAATERYERALAIWRDLGDEHGVALALHNLATDAIRQDEIERARPMLRESLTIRARLDASGDLARALSAVAEIARRTGYPGESVRLVSAACQRSVQPEQETPPELDEIRDKLGGTMFAAAWNEGMELSTDQAVGIALMVLTAAGGEA